MATNVNSVILSGALAGLSDPAKRGRASAESKDLLFLLAQERSNAVEKGRSLDSRRDCAECGR